MVNINSKLFTAIRCEGRYHKGWRRGRKRQNVLVVKSTKDKRVRIIKVLKRQLQDLNNAAN